MKKFFLLMLAASALLTLRASHVTTALTSGYVFKQGHDFKRVYGHGLVNVITFDTCYSSCGVWGGGAKLSYWRGTGHTEFLRMPTVMQQVPLTFYLRGMKEFDCRLQLYGSLGGGFTWIQEKSYLGCPRAVKGLGEIELGFSWPVHSCLFLTTAFRYLFPPQKAHSIRKIDVGGVDLRAGIEFSF